nr:hypothetical protein [Pseudomonas toyotomiensis]
MFLETAAIFLSNASKPDFPEKFNLLYKKNRFRQLFNATHNCIETFSCKDTFIFSNTKSTLALYSALFSSHAAEINKFIVARTNFESSVLQGDLNQAHAILEEISSELGESLWYVRNKLLIFSLEGKLQEMQDFAELCNSRSTDGFVTYLIRCFLLLSSDPLLHLRKFVTNTVTELEEAGIRQWSDLIKLIFIPRPLFATAEPLKCLSPIQSFCVIDQYTLVSKLATEVLAFSDIPADHQQEYIDFIKSISSRIKDYSLPDTSRHENSQRDTNSTAAKLTSLYETEQYEELIRAFVYNFRNLEAPLAFVNLIAKAAAITNPKHFYEMPGVVYQLIGNLANLYKLSTAPNQLEEKISATSVLLYNFRDSAHLQLCLYKSMPLRYKKSDWSWLAKTALFRTTESTPLAKLLATDMNPLDSREYLSRITDLPRHRVLRLALQKCEQNSGSELKELQDAFNLIPLAKDFYESVSSYYIRNNKHIELIDLCARTLAKNPNAYIAFPMNFIMEFIERETECSLNSIIIIYYYVKKIDSSKDYLLNETYEEFFGINGANRPSELLQELDITDERVLVLFRDVSSFETMDFLGSFSDSNDLRAERVRILDYLRDAEAIDPEQHREEVDEIVVQVVVDTGATEFNVAKIDVNDNALKRLISEDLLSLLSLFKSVKLEREEKIIRLDSSQSEGQAAKAVVAGNKNTTLFKMVTLIQNAFLYDEKHGLDKNLSAEIRHGFFSNLMRSKLEEAHLLTEVDESGEYKANTYWINANALVAADILTNIDKQLSWFSASFNDLVTEAEEWMKVFSGEEDTSRAFHYRMTSYEFETFHTFAEAASSADEFFDYCVKMLWEKTELCMQEMRERLNVELKNRVDSLFDELLSRINEAKSGVALMELTKSIVQTKSDIKEDITTISEWFKRNTAYASTSRSIKDLIDISIECFERVRGFRLKTVKEINSLSHVELEGRHVKAFIVALVNILENACRHSGNAQDTEILVQAEEQNKNWSIKIKNDLSSHKLALLIPEKISQIVDKMKGPLSLHMMRLEGGSGLSKAYNQLRSIHSGFDVDVSVEDNFFRTQIYYAEQHINSRRQQP